MDPLPDLGARLSDHELVKLVRLIRERSGISLHEGKRELIVARLQKRMRQGHFASFAEYLSRVESDQTGQELVTLLDAMATNHTSFFREDQHFTFLRTRAIPEWRARAPRGPFRVWSAACSTGEEPYSILITLMEAWAAADRPPLRLLASDLSTKALAVARAGVYKDDRVRQIGIELLRKYFERGMGEQAGLARVAAPVRRQLELRRLNLLEIGDLGERFDAVFCRNVMMYFDRETQQRVVDMLVRHLERGAYLFISHSESLNALRHDLRWVAPAVYQRGPA